MEIRFTPDYKANEPIFWHVFTELSKNNNGKFYAGEAVLMIEHMEKTGKIEKAEQYNAYRVGKPSTTQQKEKNKRKASVFKNCQILN